MPLRNDGRDRRHRSLRGNRAIDPRYLVMAAPIFLVCAITFIVILGYAVEQLSDTF